MSSERRRSTINAIKESSYPITLGFGPNANSSVVDVTRGRVTRVRPLHFDWQYDRKLFNPWKMEVRGKTFEPGLKALPGPYSLAYKKRVYSPNRILYPLKRVDWNPDGERNTANRGKSKYVRISWDEATTVIADELRRVRDAYGPEAILAQADGHGEEKTVHGPHGCQLKLLDLLGGYTLQTRNPDSWEGWYWGAKHVWGGSGVGQMKPDCNCMADISANGEMVLFWGCDPETTPWGLDGQMASRLCYWWTELGITSVYICPDLNYGAAVHADKWIPVLPNTDAALRLAIAYVWLTEETYDKAYVATHTYGFDKFRSYVLGDEDGIVKTPEWATGKTGVPEWTIKALARYWATKRTSIAHGNGGPGIRGPYSSENARLEILLLAMQGLGKPGVHQVKMIEWGLMGTSPMPESQINPNLHAANRGTNVPAVYPADMKDRSIYPVGLKLKAGDTYPRQFIPKDLIHDAILNPPISWYGTTVMGYPAEDQFIQYSYPAPNCPEIHMIWTDTPCWITCWNDANAYIKALRSPKIECILAQHIWLENDCLFADIILPINTKFEENDIKSDWASGQFQVLVHEKKCVEPVGESRSDYEAVCAVAEKLGLFEAYSENKSEAELIRMGFDTSGADQLVTYEELEEKGYVVIPTKPDWNKGPVGMEAFCKNPQSNPLETPSGKLEFYSQNLAKHFPDDRERPPVPHWIEKGPSHDEALSGGRAATYPLLVMSNHPRWRVHAQCDDITWTREVPTCKVRGPDGYNYEPVWLNPRTAAERSIANGDIVQVFNERGTVLGGAYVTERLREGVIYMDHGARYDPIVPGEIDRGGAINTITPHNTTSKYATGMVCSGFLADVQRADLEALRQQYPEAFKRKYDSAAGLRFDAWVVKTDIQ